ncbi:MAG: translocation/assembly module TamB [Mediterranea sp.]|jgi:hypothetical protein|nr:translocation/assembly module TamB [Mediterranea sp.]
MKRKWFKRLMWVLLTPVVLFVVLMALLYVPPVQDWLRRQVTASASEATGMQIDVRRVDLRFPLNLVVSGVRVVQRPDTLLTLDRMSLRVQAWPLLKGKVALDEVALKGATMNSARLMDGMRVEGTLGSFVLNAREIDLSAETADIARAELADTRIHLTLADTTTVADTTATEPLRWVARLRQLKLANVEVALRMPADSLALAARVGEATVNDIDVDLHRQAYGLRQLLLSGSSVTYDTGAAPPIKGFDASHIALRDLRVGLDSLFYAGRTMKAVIRQLAFDERSGLSLASATGRLAADDSLVSVPAIDLRTNHSQIVFSGQAEWRALMSADERGRLAAHLAAQVGKQDVMLLAATLPPAFKESYPYRPLALRAEADGTLGALRVSRLSMELPGAFAVKGEGEFRQLADSLRRSGTLDLGMRTGNLRFVAALTGTPPDSGAIAIPDSMSLTAKLDMQGPKYTADLRFREGGGRVALNATLNTATEEYEARLGVDTLRIQHFLPADSIYELSFTASAKGRGLDVASPAATARLGLSLGQLHYASYRLTDVRLLARLAGTRLTALASSDNALLRMKANAEYGLASAWPDGKLTLDVDRLDLREMGLIPERLERPLAFQLTAEARRDSVATRFTTGDLNLSLRARSGVMPLMEQSTRFAEVLTRQVGEKLLDHAELRRALPRATLAFEMGQDNWPADYLKQTRKISFSEASARFGTAPNRGINGVAVVRDLHVDTLRIDTVTFVARQDTAKMRLRAAVVNGPRNPQHVFALNLRSEIRDKDADLLVDFTDQNGDTGLLFGINARPIDAGRSDGVAFRLIPEEPVVAFRKFRFVERHNWIYLHNNMRVYANVDMEGKDDMGFRMRSVRGDTVSLQNIDVEIRRLPLGDLAGALPYLPRVTGLFSAEANYVRTAERQQLSFEGTVDELTYERQRVGDVMLGATWLPGDRNEQYIDAYLAHEGQQVATASGKLTPNAAGTRTAIDLDATLEHFPLRLANVFVPEEMVRPTGDMDGELTIAGTTEKPLVNGTLTLDSAAMQSGLYGVAFRLDNRPVRLEDNRLLFDKFAIHTTGKTPFTIDGYVDFKDMGRPTANLNMLATGYTLLDAKRTPKSLVYGKVFADFRAVLRGPLDALTMRGNMSLLGDTDVSYVLTDSPLTVQDRLGSLVTFTSFADTTGVTPTDVPTVSLGGLDLVMAIHIDPAVRLKVDLDAANDNRVELEGGGDLSMKYTPQGDLLLTGRYTLTGGLMKYALPVISTKEFAIENGSYVEWTGKAMDPTLNFKATDRVRASVSEGEGGSRMENFDVSVVVKNKLNNLSFAFDVAAPENNSLQNELTSMGAEERGKQAIYIMVAKTYLGTGSFGSGFGGLNMGSALNSVLSSQINSLMGNLKNASVSVGIDDYDDSSAGGKRTDYSFRYSQRLFNNRVQIVIGGKVSTGQNATNSAESFIDNISFEYRLDQSGTRYVRLFRDKNYDSILDGEITETGVGIVLRKKLDRLSELFIFKRRKE